MIVRLTPAQAAELAQQGADAVRRLPADATARAIGADLRRLARLIQSDRVQRAAQVRRRHTGANGRPSARARVSVRPQTQQRAAQEL